MLVVKHRRVGETMNGFTEEEFSFSASVSNIYQEVVLLNI